VGKGFWEGEKYFRRDNPAAENESVVFLDRPLRIPIGRRGRTEEILGVICA